MAVSGTDGTISFLDGSAPVLSGSFSKLDTAALIQASVLAKRLPADQLERQITENETRIAAYEELNGLLATLSGSLNGLRNPPGFTGLNSNAFEQKAVFLSSDSTTVATELLGVTASNTAITGTHEIIVDQIATAHKVSSATIADVDTALGVTETLTINLAGADAEETATIDVDATTTAGDLVSLINNQTSVTGVRASLIQVADSDYRLVLSAEDTNKDIEFTGDNGGATSTAIGLSADNGATYTTVLQASQPAQIFLDGITDPIVRDSNELDDVITGVTFDLFKAEAATTITLEIEADLSEVRAQIDNFVAAYNDVRTFLAAQQDVNGEGEVSETAILFGDNLVRQIGTNLGTDLGTLVSGVGASDLSNLRDIGIELNSDNLLTIDDGVLDAALVGKLDQVRAVLEFGFESDSSRVTVVGRSELLDLDSFTINVPAGAVDGTNVQVSGVDAFEVDGNVLRGITGTVYEGLSLGYSRDTSDAGEAAEDITITTTLGLAERLYQRTENFAGLSDGLVTEEVERLQTTNADLFDKIAAIDARVALFQQSLIEKFAALEAALAAADATSSQLKAFLGSNNG